MIHTLTIIRFLFPFLLLLAFFCLYKETVPLHAKLHVEDGSI